MIDLKTEVLTEEFIAANRLKKGDTEQRNGENVKKVLSMVNEFPGIIYLQDKNFKRPGVHWAIATNNHKIMGVYAQLHQDGVVNLNDVVDNKGYNPAEFAYTRSATETEKFFKEAGVKVRDHALTGFC